MDELHELKARIRRLEDIEAIKQIKANYFNALDQQDWDKLDRCFCAGSIWESARRNVKIEGAEAIVRFLREIEEGEQIINGHYGHNFQVELLDETRATATCELCHYREDKALREQKISGAFYVDDYMKIDGLWKIKHTRVLPTYLNVSHTRSDS